MVGLNKILVIGNVGTEPEMRYTPSGRPITTFRIAATRNYTSGGERKQETEWFTVVAWNQLAEQASNFLKKGRRAYVEGRLRSNQWTGQDGATRFRNEIIADRILFLDRQPAEGQGEEAQAPAPEGGEAVDADDLPF
ncbi:MAG: single-stranded DNA-binding protein [Chloroflexi bacterium]|nr:single-stranded DNA-binding protein [Chloroflexota bacterium]